MKTLYSLLHQALLAQDADEKCRHAIAHIEFNAINLALDAAYRFRSLPREFTGDWLGVAKEECDHFLLMRERLREHGFDYGDFPAHAHLWDMARQTAYDPLLRMALVPRVLEARGLDVTPAIRAKVAQRGDTATCEVLDIIYRDEVGHVRIGNRWYHHLCQERQLEPMALFRRLLQQHDMFVFRGYGVGSPPCLIFILISYKKQPALGKLKVQAAFCGKNHCL